MIIKDGNNYECWCKFDFGDRGSCLCFCIYKFIEWFRCESWCYYWVFGEGVGGS